MTNFPNDLLTKIKVDLEQQQNLVTRRIAELSLQDPFINSDRTNDNAAVDAEASEEFNHDRVVALVAELVREQAEINAALGRISQNRYGVCINCGKSIDGERLKILPTAALCAACGHQKKS